ncbi:MAG: hypothetical protein JOZ04_08790, partial [Acidimicrobiia bacterium]|nr:hypothetical protein [Acidimicrobiia bacterium]
LGPRYIRDPWARRALAAIDPDAPVLLVGSGLTAVDVALTLAGRGHRGPIDTISRHGLLPRRHAPWPVTPDPRPAITPGPGMTTGALLRAVVRAARDAERGGGDWRSVVDGLRPVTQSLWRSMPDAERRRFLRRAARVWEVHRHRMAPTVAASVDDLVASGRLVVRGGLIESVTAEPRALTVTLRPGANASADVRVKGRATRQLRVGHIINCTGPSTDVAASCDTLLRSLLATGAARPDPLGLGLDVTDGGALVSGDGTPSPALWTLGPMCRGRLWETTAVPEIREQACVLATALVGERQRLPVSGWR